MSNEVTNSIIVKGEIGDIYDRAYALKTFIDHGIVLNRAGIGAV